MLRNLFLVVLAAIIAVLNSSPAKASPADVVELERSGVLPRVDLGYAIYRPTSLNQTGQYYNFSNIRYAAPPLGKLRFSAPELPLDERGKGVQDGTIGFVCPQAQPAGWAAQNAALGPAGALIPAANSSLPESEDCLFLDVVVPTSVFDKKHHRRVPVLVNIHGGGFFIGDKTTLYDPQGLLLASQNGIVYVSMNYRLTAFGFLGGLGDSLSNKTSPNAGLLDQRMALKWIQKWIHLFGGDPNQVTISGESGGGASVMFHTVAYGAAKESENHLFVRALGQSPGPIITKAKNQKLVSNAYLSALNVSSADEARKLPKDVLIQANRQIEAQIGLWGPVVDGDLVPDLPSRLYTSGRYIRNLTVMAGHNSNEAALFVSPLSNSQAAFDSFVHAILSTATPSQVRYINETLFPPPSPATQQPPLSYSNQHDRLSLLDADVYNICWTVLLASIYAPRSHNYIFSVPPGFHAQDLAYTFYNGQWDHVNTTVARVLQGYVANFALKGDPNGPGLPGFPAWSRGLKGNGEMQVVNLTESGFSVVSEAAAERCDWWFETAFAGSN